MYLESNDPKKPKAYRPRKSLRKRLAEQHLAEELAQAAREKARAQAEADFLNSSTVQAAMELRELFAKHEAERQAKRAQQAQALSGI